MANFWRRRLLRRKAGSETLTKFLVRLPVQHDVRSVPVPVAVSDASPAPPVGSASLAGVDVLLVDDEEATLALFRDSLEATGATVRAVTSAADALRANDDCPADLLVTDLALPHMNGYQLLEAIRATNPGIPAVAVTAYARLDNRSRSLAAGFQAHVPKPI